MATTKMIDLAAQGDRMPSVPATMHHEAESSLYRPRASEDAEALERVAAGRTVLRMVLGRHGCGDLAVCACHGRDLCPERSCSHAEHGDDVVLAVEALEAFGLKVADAPARRCSTCHLVRSADRFPGGKETCKTCLYRRSKAGRAVGDSA